MATGWAKDGAVQDQIDATVKDAVDRAKRNLHAGPSRKDCAECGELIAEARREAMPAVQLCLRCQDGADRKETPVAGYNRRGSKDSQLR